MAAVGTSIESVLQSRWLDNEKAESIIRNLQTAYPGCLLVLFLVFFTAHGIWTANTAQAPVQTDSQLTGPGGKPLPQRQQRRKLDEKVAHVNVVRRLAFTWISIGLVVTFLANAANVVVHALIERHEGWWCGVEGVTYVVGSAFLYSLFLISIIDSETSPNVVHLITWLIALAAETALFGLLCSIYTSVHHEINTLPEHHGKLLEEASQWEIVELACNATRLLLLLAAVVTYAIFSLQTAHRNGRLFSRSSNVNDERAPLLHASGMENGSINTNGTFQNGGADGHAVGISNGNATGAVANGTAVNGSTGNGPAGPDDAAAFYRPTEAPSRSWWEYIRGYSLFFPYLWPAKSVRLQMTVLVCFVLVLLQRVINALVPIQAGKVTDLLSDEEGENAGMPWTAISLFIAYKLLQGPSGALGAARSVLWIPVAQYSYAALSTASFEHVHGLSLEFHLGKRTGEVLSALSKGAAINTFLEQVTFQVLPMLIDLGVAVGIFIFRFDAYYALTVAIITFWYLYITVRLAQWRAEQRRKMVNADREEDAVKNDSIQSYETVKYFGAEVYEFRRYAGAVRNYQEAEYSVMLSLNFLNIAQNLVFMAGLLVVSFIAAYQVTTGIRRVGDFVALLTYMQQLQQPLNFFGTFYRSVQSAMISGERLLELFKEQPTVKDQPNAIDLPSCEGLIRFDNVKFAYDRRKPALQNLSFTCQPGTTTALVGESGGGKSTVFRLLFRFYNFLDGSIQLDGHDVRDITIKALRSHVGVVPQDTVLFNETLMYNLRYANQDATDEDIFNACRAASIHEKILSFPDGYQTKVGERGLRLSGGEKQRVAIARTILKNPRIIMLDEATAALDSETEENIQEALKTLSQGRTMLVIAHRLSTITNADQILVLHQGSVVESGTHEELLAKKGRYSNMWRKQSRAEKVAEQARVLTDRAAALRDEALTRPNSRDGTASDEVSESEAEASAAALQLRNKLAPSLAGSVLGRAADGLRGAASLVRGHHDDDGRPPGHP